MDQQPMEVSSQEPKTNKKWWILGGLVVLALIAVFIISPSTPKEPQGIAVGDRNGLAIDDQEANALAVTVRQFSCTTSCFVVIHENINGNAGTVIGTSKVYAPGLYTEEAIIAGIKNGGGYIGMLHADNGNGTFSAIDDVALTDPAGAMISVPFKVKSTTNPDKG